MFIKPCSGFRNLNFNIKYLIYEFSISIFNEVIHKTILRNRMKNNIEKIVENVLIQNRIGDYDKKDLELQLQIHPNYPSFQSITDTLDYFDIDNIAVEVPTEALDQLPESFISLVKTERSEEIVSVINKNNSIEITHTSLSKKKYNYDQFKEIWAPKVIAVEYSEKQKFSFGKSFLQTLLISVLALSIVASLFLRPWNIGQALFLLVSLAGLIFSYFALQESLGIQSQTIHQFCTTVGNTNCGDVINNNSGKLFKNFTLSDAGIAFFGSLILYQVFFGFTNILIVPAVIGIPFVAYSLYSQAFIIKKWCAICLTIAAVSIALAVLALRNLEFSIDSALIPSFLMLATLFTLGYLFIKEKLVENKGFKADNLKLNQFKRDSDIYKHLYTTSDKITDNSPIENEIVLGNPNATFKIISYTNPMCGYCKDAFGAYSRVLKTMGENLQITVRLGANLEDFDSEVSKITLRLLEIYDAQGADHFITAYNEWFADRTFSKWSKKYGTPVGKSKHIEVIKKQSEWSINNDLRYTPASVINGTVYPKKYSYTEFFHFIGIMLEEHMESVSETEQAIEM